MNFAGIVSRIVQIANLAITLIAALSLVVFIYGLVAYLYNSGDAEKRQESIRYIFSGIIGLFIMVAVWGILAIVANSFGLRVFIPRI